jgi:apolipoprotein N-acyltransferase
MSGVGRVMVGRRFEPYLAGSVMLLLGLILVGYLAGLSSPRQIPSLFLAGVGVIFSLLAIFKVKTPAKYEMSARTTLAYGLLSLIIGVLWFSVSLGPEITEYMLALLLVLRRSGEAGLEDALAKLFGIRG